MFSLQGKTALVTGATGGIGAAVARVLHGAGATVAISGTGVFAATNDRIADVVAVARGGVLTSSAVGRPAAPTVSSVRSPLRFGLVMHCRAKPGHDRAKPAEETRTFDGGSFVVFFRSYVDRDQRHGFQRTRSTAHETDSRGDSSSHIAADSRLVLIWVARRSGRTLRAIS